MIYLLHEATGDDTIILEGDSFKHMIKARRHTVGDKVLLRKLDDENNYTYLITQSSKKEATLSLDETFIPPKQLRKSLHLAWCMIDPKSIEKVLPSLCELGVSTISFIYAHRSQKNFTIDEKRVNRILLNSMQQCGRYDMMQIFLDVSLEDFINQHPNCAVLDFCETTLRSDDTFTSVLLGPEGGFDDQEKQLLKDLAVRRLDTPMILRSETAALAIASKILL